MTSKILLEIAREHARRGAKMQRNKKGLYRYRIGPHTDLLGILIPQSIYYAVPKIEWETTYGLCDGNVWPKEALWVINRIDHIQAFFDQDLWVPEIDKLLQALCAPSHDLPWTMRKR